MTGTLYANLALGIALTLLAFLITLGVQHVLRIVDTPLERSSHYAPTPKSGGISIVVTFLIGMIIIYFYGDPDVVRHVFMFGFVSLSVVVAAVSLYDDVTNRSARFKLMSHIIIVVATLISGIVLDELALPTVGYVELHILGYLISFLWILGLTNAFNFMDGIDGLAAGTAVIAALFFMLITFIQGSLFVYITCYAILAGALGFLFANFPPAKIFMGDVGSAFLLFGHAATVVSLYL